MSHVDPEALALLALGESATDPGDGIHAAEAHLADCPECRESLAQLVAVTRIGRESLSLAPLTAPAPEVWSRIAAELGLHRGATAPRPTAVAGARWRRALPLLAAAAAVVLVAGAGVTAWRLLRPVPPTVVATATLDPFPDWTAASGTAVVERLPGGERVVRISLDSPAQGGDYREAWLITEDSSALLSLGVVDSATATLIIPSGVDLSLYDLVDVSSESYDGNPAHSGDSIVRGRLG